MILSISIKSVVQISKYGHIVIAFQLKDILQLYLLHLALKVSSAVVHYAQKRKSSSEISITYNVNI